MRRELLTHRHTVNQKGDYQKYTLAQKYCSPQLWPLFKLSLLLIYQAHRIHLLLYFHIVGFFAALQQLPVHNFLTTHGISYGIHYKPKIIYSVVRTQMKGYDPTCNEGCPRPEAARTGLTNTPKYIVHVSSTANTKLYDNPIPYLML